MAISLCVHVGATALYALGHDRCKVRTGRESHSHTLGVRVWLCETRVRILRYRLEASLWVRNSIIAMLITTLSPLAFKSRAT